MRRRWGMGRRPTLRRRFPVKLASGGAWTTWADMRTILTILVGLAMLGTLGVLFAGMLGLVRGGGDPRRSNALMRWRVLLQGVALLLFIILLSLLRS